MKPHFSQQYEAATQEFLETVETIPHTDLDRRDQEGWSPRQIIHHVADSETQSYARLRRLIAEPGTVIQGYDENKWAQNLTLGYNMTEIDDSLEVIKAVRKSSLALINRLTELDLKKSGEHSESGNYSVMDWLETYIKHPIDHAHQIKKILQSR